MRIDGIKLLEGSSITNAVIASGSVFPTSPDSGELFFRNSGVSDQDGLFTYRDGTWHRISTDETLTIPNGSVLPTTTLPGQFFYLNSNVPSTEGLYYYDSEDGWDFFANTSYTLNTANSYALDQAIAMAIALG